MVSVTNGVSTFDWAIFGVSVGSQAEINIDADMDKTLNESGPSLLIGAFDALVWKHLAHLRKGSLFEITCPAKHTKGCTIRIEVACPSFYMWCPTGQAPPS